jgi:hypothetical protein
MYSCAKQSRQDSKSLHSTGFWERGPQPGFHCIGIALDFVDNILQPCGYSSLRIWWYFFQILTISLATNHLELSPTNLYVGQGLELTTLDMMNAHSQLAIGPLRSRHYRQRS